MTGSQSIGCEFQLERADVGQAQCFLFQSCVATSHIGNFSSLTRQLQRRSCFRLITIALSMWWSVAVAGFEAFMTVERSISPRLLSNDAHTRLCAFLSVKPRGWPHRKTAAHGLINFTKRFWMLWSLSQNEDYMGTLTFFAGRSLRLPQNLRERIGLQADIALCASTDSERCSYISSRTV